MKPVTVTHFVKSVTVTILRTGTAFRNTCSSVLCLGLLAAAQAALAAEAPTAAHPSRPTPEQRAADFIDRAIEQAGIPVLQDLILISRDDAVRAGVEPIPAEIRQALAGFIPDAILDVVRYRVQGGEDFTLQVNAIRYGDARAITLDHVVVFRDADEALKDAALWVHELTHVAQYQRWGTREFASRYLRDFQAVEAEAYEAVRRFGEWRATKPP